MPGPDDPRLILATVCGGSQADRCSKGGEHDMSAERVFRDSQGRITGGSVACAKCGMDAMTLDMMRLP